MADDPKLLSAYEQFMLGGGRRGGGKGKGNEQQQSQQQQQKTTVADVSDGEKRRRSFGKTNKGGIINGIRPAIKVFQSRVKEYWNDHNQHAFQLVKSISHLRQRIYHESKQIVDLTKKKKNFIKTKTKTNNNTCNESRWYGCGYRSTSSSRGSGIGHHHHSSLLLTENDIQMALDYDLLQHERMLMALRTTLASMGQTIDAIGRRLDEWMMILEQQQHEERLEEEEEHDLRRQFFDHDHRHLQEHESSSLLLETARQLFVLLSEDLYWKQKAVEAIMESSHEGLVVVLLDGDCGANTTTKTSSPFSPTDVNSLQYLHDDPQTVARKIVHEWNNGRRGTRNSDGDDDDDDDNIITVLMEQILTAI